MAWHATAKADEIGENEVLGTVVEGRQIALYNIGGSFYATSNICTHEFAFLSDGYVEDDCIECPLHQARFHIATGEARAAPADQPIETYPVKLEDGRLFVDLPA